jgi:hypothetical protein
MGISLTVVGFKKEVLALKAVDEAIEEAVAHYLPHLAVIYSGRTNECLIIT